MKSLAKNFAWSFLYQVLVTALPLITAPYLARILGADRIGTYSFVQSIVSYFTLFAVLGTALYGQRTVARANARGESRKQKFLEVLILRIAGSAISLILYFQLVCRFADDKVLYWIAAIDILAVSFDISWFYQGVEQFGTIAICNGISKILAVVFIFSFVKSRADLNLYVLISCGALLIGNAVQWLFLPPLLKGQSLDRLHPAQHMRPVFLLFVSQVAIQVYTVLDKTMIGLISGSYFENGYYDGAQKIIKGIIAVVTSIGAVMTSRVAVVWNANCTERDKKIQGLLLLSFQIIFAVGLPIAVGLDIIASRFVPIFFGDGYEPVVQLLKVLAWVVPTIGCSNIVGMQLFIPSGRETLVTRSVMLGAIVNVILNLWLISSLGAMGASIASVIAELSVAGAQILLARKELPLRRIFGLFVRYASYSILMGALGCILSSIMPLGFGGMMGIVLVCAGVYVGLLLVTKDTLFAVLHGRY